MDLDNITVDSSLMYPTTSRRFLMALWEMDGKRVALVPRAVQEMYGFVRQSEERFCQRALHKQTERTGRIYSPGDRQIIIDAAVEAAGEWVNDELGDDKRPGNNSSALILRRLNAEEADRARTLAEAIPSKCFRGPSKNSFFGDREIIGQSIAAGFAILASDNRSSIRRVQLNGWIKEHTGIDGNFVLDADQALEEAGHWTTQPTKLLEAVLRAALPSRPRSVERENEIVIQFITRLGREGWKHIAVACDEEWRSAEAEIAYTSARAFIAEEGSHARDTEARRIERIRKATSNAGYDIGR